MSAPDSTAGSPGAAGSAVDPDDEPTTWEMGYDDNVVCERCGGDGSIEYDDAGPDVWGEDCPSQVNHLVKCPDCRGTGARDGIEDDEEGRPLGKQGCLFPRVCCMPGDHYTSECHTPEDLMTQSEAMAYRRWMRKNRRNWRRDRQSMNAPGSATTGGQT